MTRLTNFFHAADTELSVFYPRGYVLAVFPELAAADRAQQEFHNAGRADDDIITVSGAEVLQFAEDHLMNDGLWGALMTKLSRILGAEAAYAEDDLAAARNGAAFLAVHCPTERLKRQAWSLLQEHHPLAARYYSAGGIESMPGEAVSEMD